MNKKPWILAAVAKAKHKVFDNGDYDLNIIGLRNPKGEPDKFDDLMFVCYKKNGLWQMESFQITTDPGMHFLKNPANVNGTAILKAGQYRGVYRIGKHRGKYSAGCQVFKRAEDLDRLLWLCQMQIKTHKWPTFTYTLLDKKK